MKCPVCQQDAGFRVKFMGPANYDRSGNIEDMMVVMCKYCKVRLIRIQREAVLAMDETCSREWTAMAEQIKAGTYKS
jgi:hypothetical protein